jgi:SAM-dependent methyltransferase
VSKGLCQNGTPIPFYDFESAGQSYNWSDDLDNTLDEEITGIHPIDFYERKTVADYIKTYRRRENPKDESIICDFGCSLGYMLKEIKKDEPDALMLGADVIDVSLAKLNKSNPDFMLFKLDIRHISFPDEMLDAAICLNVLEHIDDDEKVISEFNRTLKKGGVVCIVVPYGRKLYDYYDGACMHVRRYGKRELIGKLESAGFEILRSNFLNSLLYLPFFIKKKINRLTRKTISDEEKARLMENDAKATSKGFIIRMLFNFDYQLSKRFKLPFGIREIVVARKV